MDLQKMIAELQAERTRLDEAILALERLVASKGSKRRGRPPKWMRGGTGSADGDGSGSSHEPADGTLTRVAAYGTKR